MGDAVMPNLRVMIVVPAAAKAAANLAARHWDEAVSSREQSDSDQTFGEPGLSASGQLPVSHFGCSTVVSARRLAKLRDRLGNLPPAVKFAVLRGPEPSGEVVETNVPALEASPAGSFDAMLEALGFRAIAD